MKIYSAVLFIFLAASYAEVAFAQFGLPFFNKGSSVPNAVSNSFSSVTNQLANVKNLFVKQFGDFKSTFNKVYSSPEEEDKRLKIFSLNQQKILDLETIQNLPYTLKLNEFADLISEEFNKLLNGLKVDRSKNHGNRFQPEAAPQIPNGVDWRERGGVTPVRSQGKCGCCYAFAAAGALEGHTFRKTGKLLSLSPQNIIDCSQKKPYENGGCAAGYMDPSYEYIKDNNGINSDSSYPYEAKTNSQCQYKSDDSAATVKGYNFIDEGDEKGLEEVLNKKGPISVAMDAHHQSFQFYGGGIYYEPKCSSNLDDLNHAVLLIGYGTEKNGDKYWLIKNSYGTSWGDNGFVKIARNVTNHCGIASYALYPQV